jgi:hypothetical protein
VRLGQNFKTRCSLDTSLAKHPAVFATIILICTALGVVLGYYSKYFGSGHRMGMIAGALGGCMLGVFFSFLWGLIATALDL